MGFFVGGFDGIFVGDRVGCLEKGDFVGFLLVFLIVGFFVDRVGAFVGLGVGWLVGAIVGLLVGRLVGAFVGLLVG